jgi:hypothetical protein
MTPSKIFPQDGSYLAVEALPIGRWQHQAHAVGVPVAAE